MTGLIKVQLPSFSEIICFFFRTRKSPIWILRTIRSQTTESACYQNFLALLVY